MILLLLIIVTTAAGVFGMMGLAGGIVYVPVLSWWGFDLKTGAIPLSLLLGSATGGMAAFTYWREKMAHPKVSMFAAAGALAGAPLGARMVPYIPVGILKALFAAAALFISIRILRSREPAEARIGSTWIILAGALAVGLFVGLSSGLLGIGGGFLFIPFMLSAGFPTKHAVATSAIVVAISTMAAFLWHLPRTTFPPALALLLLAGVVTGSRLGGLWAARRARPETLRVVVGSLIFLVSVKMGLEGLALLFN